VCAVLPVRRPATWTRPIVMALQLALNPGAKYNVLLFQGYKVSNIGAFMNHNCTCCQIDVWCPFSGFRWLVPPNFVVSATWPESHSKDRRTMSCWFHTRGAVPTSTKDNVTREIILSLFFETVVNVVVGISKSFASFATFVPFSLLSEKRCHTFPLWNSVSFV